MTNTAETNWFCLLLATQALKLGELNIDQAPVLTPVTTHTAHTVHIFIPGPEDNLKKPIALT